MKSIPCLSSVLCCESRFVVPFYVQTLFWEQNEKTCEFCNRCKFGTAICAGIMRLRVHTCMRTGQIHSRAHVKTGSVSSCLDPHACELPLSKLFQNSNFFVCAQILKHDHEGHIACVQARDHETRNAELTQKSEGLLIFLKTDRRVRRSIILLHAKGKPEYE